MACRLYGAKPLPEPMPNYCQLDPYEQNKIWFKVQNFSFTKMHSIMSSAKCRPFCPGRDELRATDTDILYFYGTRNIWRITKFHFHQDHMYPVLRDIPLDEHPISKYISWVWVLWSWILRSAYQIKLYLTEKNGIYTNTIVSAYGHIFICVHISSDFNTWYI